MSQIRISGNPADWKNWEKLIQRCDMIEELTDLEKEKTKRAFLFLKKEFGDEFLEYAVDEVDPHPFAYYIINSAPWTSKWLMRFSDALKSLKEADGYPSLLKRLKNKDMFVEGESVLEVAYKFHRAGFNIVIDPSTAINRKVPDLKITNKETGEELFVEVSMQQLSMNHAKAIRTFNEVFDKLSFSIFDLTFCGRIFKVLSERHMSEVLKEVENKIEIAKSENVFQELIIEDTIELGIAPYKDKDVLAIWAKSRGLNFGQFIGPSINVDEIQRLRLKIQKEQKQLPQNSPSILVVGNNSLFHSLHDIKKGINELEECLYEFSNILFLIGTGFHECYDGITQDEMVMKDQHIFVRRLREDSSVEQCMILLNRYCDFHISPATISKVYLAFTKY